MFSSFARPRSLLLPIAVAAALLASACSKSPDAPAQTVLGIQGTLNGYSYSVVPDTGCIGANAGFNQTGLDLTGNLAPLVGTTTWTSQHCNKTVTSSPLLIDAYSLNATMTSTNGDQISFTYALGETALGSGTMIPGTSATSVTATPRPIADFVIAVTITGGTGEFANAKGTALFSCVRTTPIAGDPALPAHTPAYSNIYACTLTGTVTMPA